MALCMQQMLNLHVNQIHNNYSSYWHNQIIDTLTIWNNIIITRRDHLSRCLFLVHILPPFVCYRIWSWMPIVQIIYVSETICDSPPHIANADAEGENHKYDDVVLYTCKGEMRFAYGRTSKTIRCMESREWNETDLSCEGNVTCT